jgi:hypothetical protein
MAVVTVPACLWINGVEHTLELRAGLIIGSDCQGRSCDNLAQIEIDSSLKSSQRAEVLIHECLHRIEYALGWGCGGTKDSVLSEKQTLALGKSLAALCHELDIEFDFSRLPQTEGG